MPAHGNEIFSSSSLYFVVKRREDNEVASKTFEIMSGEIVQFHLRTSLFSRKQLSEIPSSLSENDALD